METNRKKRALGALITGTIISGSLVSANTANAANMFDFEDLGSGAELRSDLLDASTTGFMSAEAKCGEGKCGEEKSEAKSAEHKCGEGKCGEEKSSEHSCGEDHEHEAAPATAPAGGTESSGSDAPKTAPN